MPIGLRCHLSHMKQMLCPRDSLSSVVIRLAIWVGFFTACGRESVIWSTQSQSKDGNWLVTARTIQHVGPGANSVETVVELQRKTGLKSLSRILAFANDGKSMNLQIVWVAPDQLQVSFKDDPKVLYYQVIRTSGINISVRNLAGS